MRGGIIFPNDWEKILEKDVIEKPSKEITAEELAAKLVAKLRECADTFKGNKFCLALSGGIDSSILAVLLKNFVKVDFTCITIGKIGHPDIYYAEIMAKRFGLKHRVFFLIGNRKSENIYDDLFWTISQFGFRYSIHADAIDELTAGYWLHRLNADNAIFQNYWQRLTPEHLDPMRHHAKQHNVAIGLPYLAAHDILRRLPMYQRATNLNHQGKIILRELARNLDIPDKIIARSKLGLCDIWKEFGNEKDAVL